MCAGKGGGGGAGLIRGGGGEGGALGDGGWALEDEKDVQMLMEAICLCVCR